MVLPIKYRQSSLFPSKKNTVLAIILYSGKVWAGCVHGLTPKATLQDSVFEYDFNSEPIFHKVQTDIHC